MARGEAKAPTFTPDIIPQGGIAGWTIEFYGWALTDAYSTVSEITKAGVVLDPVAATWEVTLLAADTKTMTPGMWGWEAWRIDSGSESLLASGQFELLKAKHTIP
jgi:hypothetical protein